MRYESRHKRLFVNQALNTLYNFSVRPLTKIKGTWYSSVEYSPHILNSESLIYTADTREIKSQMDLWITDPPYADAVNYHELGEYFSAWYEKSLAHTFPEWTSTIRFALAVKGNGHDFKQAMVEIYANLANNMPDNGLQMVQFTHQDPAVWADLGMILWAAGLHVSSAGRLRLKPHQVLKKVITFKVLYCWYYLNDFITKKFFPTSCPT